MQVDFNSDTGSTNTKVFIHKFSENYNKCRCCLTSGNHQYNLGQPELEMLMENLNLFLTMDPRLPRLICSDCFTSLNEVRSFRQRVLASEDKLQRALSCDIKYENMQLSQSDPLEISDVKSEHDFELDSSINSETGDDKADNKSKPAEKTEKDLRFQNKTNIEAKEKKILKPRRLRAVPKSSVGLHLIPKGNKGLRLVTITSKDVKQNSKGLRVASIKSNDLQQRSQRLQLVPISIKNLPHLVSINSKDLPQDHEGVRLVPISSKDIRPIPQNSGALLIPGNVKNEEKSFSKDSKKRRINDCNIQTESKKRIKDTKTEKKECESESDTNENWEPQLDTKNTCETESDDKKNCVSDSENTERDSEPDRIEQQYSGSNKNEHDSDSNTPVCHTKEELDLRASMLSKLETRRHLLLIDNNKVRSNILLILENSTIMPFKNNSQFAFKCFYCNMLFVPFKELKEHVKIEHKQVAINVISKIVKLMQNLVVTADISSIKCRLCDEKCDSIENLIKHLCDVHEKVYHETDRKPSHGILGVDLGTDSLKCHICKQEHRFFKNLLIHMNDHYGAFVCFVCGKKFLSERRYNSHVTSSHANNEIKCKECSKVFKTEPAMKYHMKRVHLKTRVKCLFCPETFTSGNYVKRLNHMVEVHGVAKPEFKCDICGKQLANSGSVANHKKYTHKQAKMNRCELCGYMTCSNTTMKNHMIVHTGEKNFECEFCKKRFAKLGTLKLHLKIHLNDKRFACVLCDVAFIQKNSLKNHMKSRHPDADFDINKL